MVLDIIWLILRVLVVILALEGILTWFPSLKKKEPTVSKVVGKISAPFLEFWRAFVPKKKTRGVDISPILAVVVLQGIGVILMVLFR